MKRFSIIVFLLMLGFGSAQNTADQQLGSLNYEHILSFHSDIEISKNAEITVTEKIKVYSQGQSIKRGIFRSLPLWRNINGKKVRI